MSKHPLQLSTQQTEAVQSIIQKFPIIQQVTHELRQRNGKAFLVGGIVRDIILDLSVANVDIDIEIHGIEFSELEAVLQKFGPVSHVGKSFGVLKIAYIPIDWSLPRLDSSGRKPVVTIVGNLPIEDALRRRDVTMNAMAIDLNDLKLYDPFGGWDDIQHKRLRSPDPQFFTQDPLRFYRVMHFIGRFAMYPDEVLQNVCKNMDIAHISRERIEMEFHKLFLKSHQPSQGIRWLQDIGRIGEVLPEIAHLQGVVQSPQWHPEGDVFEHTMQALDAAATLKYDHVHEKLTVMYAALCHDVGKAVSTTIEEGRVRSIGHEIAGIPLVKSLLKCITVNKTLCEIVCVLVRYHMMPGQLVTNKASLAAYKRLAHKVAPLINLKTLGLLAIADKRGRNPHRGIPLHEPVMDIDTFVKRAQEAGVYLHPEAPLLAGADLLDVVQPGPQLGKLLQKAYEMQINQGITDKALLKKRLLQK